MPRSSNAVASRARRKRVLKAAKGYYGKRKNVYTVAKNVMEKGLTYSYVGRKLKKREYRALWIARINAAVRAEGMTYSQFIHKLNEKNIDLNRKVLADMAMNEPESFKRPYSISKITFKLIFYFIKPFQFWDGFFISLINHSVTFVNIF